ncbi:Tn3 family transposase [Agaribacterium sp. ZY112]|uniref:Tn3 family transposase n=1 Tax=Agaribacterium sp. ZY112 TaxID=3233574 RepID=UPI0035234BBA
MNKVTNTQTIELRRKEFDTPSKYNEDFYYELFSLTELAKAHYLSLRESKSRLLFILQYAYCKAESRFYSPREFRDEHITYVVTNYSKLSDLKKRIRSKKDLKSLKEELARRDAHRHQDKIVNLLSKKSLSKRLISQLTQFAEDQAEKQCGPEVIFESIVAHCMEQGWIIPKFKDIFELVEGTHRVVEKRLICNLDKYLPKDLESDLLDLLKGQGKSCPINQLKDLNESHKPAALKSNAIILERLKKLHIELRPILEVLNLNDQAIAYYQYWVRSNSVASIKNLRNKKKQCLYLIGFCAHEFNNRLDAAAKAFLKAFKTARNKAQKQLQDEFYSAQGAIGQMEAVIKHGYKIDTFANHIIDIGQDINLTAEQKVEEVVKLAQGIVAENEDRDKALDTMNQAFSDWKSDRAIFNRMAENNILSQLTTTVKQLIFDSTYGDANLFDAIVAFQLGDDIPTSYMETKHKKILKQKCHDDTHIVVLFDYMEKGLKGGRANLKWGYRYRAFQTYLVSEERWGAEKHKILKRVGMSQFEDFESVKHYFKVTLNDGWDKINEEHKDGSNTELTFYRNTNRPKLKNRRKADDEAAPQVISDYLDEVGNIDLIKLLREVNKAVPFMNRFFHHSNRHVSREVDQKIIEAAIIALGCNIGVGPMAKRSGDSISSAKLLDAVRHRVLNDKLREANDLLLDAIEEIPLSRIFRRNSEVTHISADGQKLLVLGDSLLADKSFKYFGSAAGVVRYLSVNDKQGVVETKVINAATREATYVLDMISNNTTPYTMVSTDSHGQTEAVFATSYLMGVSFCPRIKKLSNKPLYGARPKSYYTTRNCKIAPSETIAWNKIESQWDEVLRFVATIKLGKSSASQLFERLNSYSKEHPLFAALKHLGRAEKSIFALRYFSNEELRGSIQKQLNIGEQANNFTNAVRWAKGRKLGGSQAVMEQQLLATDLIQNAVIYWNYLYISEKLLEIENSEERELEIKMLSEGQIMAWAHVNFSGIYEFDKLKEELHIFNTKRLKKMKVTHFDKPLNSGSIPIGFPHDLTDQDESSRYVGHNR